MLWLCVEDYLQVCFHQKIELLLVLVTVVMKILKNVQNCRTHVWSYYHTTRKHLRGRTEAEINKLLLEGISESGRPVTHEIIPKKLKQLNMQSIAPKKEALLLHWATLLLMRSKLYKNI
jgi:hypothetical protein